MTSEPLLEAPSAAEPNLLDPATYPREPTRVCDLVMKGGVTSGVVYPLAVCEIARAFRLKNVGGTSAGAIAAAATAAAELGRQRGVGKDGGFAQIATLPAFLATDDHAYALFQPQPATAPLFRMLVAATDQRAGRLGRLAMASLAGFKRWALLGAMLGLVVVTVIAYLWTRLPSSLVLSALAAVGTLAGAALVVVGSLVGAAVGAARRAAGAVPRNYFGICTGFGAGQVNGVPPLTVWLADFVDRLAGVPGGGEPLTFGDLWGLDRGSRGTDAWRAQADALAADPGARRINLEIVTTCLTLGRPFRFPFETRAFYFKPEEMRDLFPERVVAWMEAHPRPVLPAEMRADAAARAAGCLPLPAPADLPVVVAARMSLSVPPLISAVPLHAIDFGLPLGIGQTFQVEHCWFTDGGATSNFPVHFFDSPLPRWPTFAIDLREAPPRRPIDKKDEARNVYLTGGNAAGLLPGWTRFDAEAGGLGGFFGALLRTMQNWNDNLQAVQPGYRDRVAHVNLAPDEGGMNLRMPGDVIGRLSRRGRVAGRRLVERFATPAGDGTGLTWDNHRWVRYRTTMAALEALLTAVARGYAAPQLGDRPYADLIRRTAKVPPGSYRWGTAAQQAFAAGATTDVVDLATAWSGQAERFAAGAPRPGGHLRVVPRW